METTKVVLDQELLRATDLAGKRRRIDRSALIRQAPQRRHEQPCVILRAALRNGAEADPRGIWLPVPGSPNRGHRAALRS